MLLCSQKFDNSHTSSIYFSTLLNTKCLMLGGKWLVSGNWHTQKPTPEPSWHFKFFDGTKTAVHSKHLHANVTEMYGKGKYVEINDNKDMTVSWKFHHHDTLPVRWYSKSIQTGSLASSHHRSCSSHEKKQKWLCYTVSSMSLLPKMFYFMVESTLYITLNWPFPFIV